MSRTHYTFEVSAKQLKRMDLFGKSDPYFVINTPDTQTQACLPKIGNAGVVTVSTTVSLMLPIVSTGTTYESTKAHHEIPVGYRQIYVSPMFKRTLSCSWPPFTISEMDLCDHNIDQELQFICYDWDRGRASDLIGEVKTSVRRLQNLEGSALTLVKADKSKRGLLFIKCTTSGDKSPRFLDAPHKAPRRTPSALNISHVPPPDDDYNDESGTPKAQAMYGYKAVAEDQLNVKAGDIVIVHSADDDWLECELNGKRGYVPASLMALL